MAIHLSGSMAYDRIMNFRGQFEDYIIPDQIRKLNISFAVEEFRETFGGSAANIAYTLKLLAENPFVYAAVGSDSQKYLDRFKSLGLSSAGVKIYPKTLTPAAYIITDRKDNQISGFFAGAMIFPSFLPKAGKGDLAMISPGNPNQSLDLVELYQQKQVNFIFDPGQQIIQFTRSQLKKALKLARAYIVNDYEFSLTLKITGYDKNSLLQNAGVLIVTRGERGSEVEIFRGNRGEKVAVPSVKAKKAVDPTGCGDAYRAGLLKGLALSPFSLEPENYFKIDWLKCGQIGSLAATYAVENYGTQTHQFSWQSFQRRFYREFKEKL